MTTQNSTTTNDHNRPTIDDEASSGVSVFVGLPTDIVGILLRNQIDLLQTN
jgi:hypothetical protein